MLPVDEVQIDPVKVNDIRLGKCIYTKEQFEEFARFQDSQGTRKAYLAETAEMAYTGRNEKGEWGLGCSDFDFFSYFSRSQPFDGCLWTLGA
jgi:hypothetical protein